MDKNKKSPHCGLFNNHALSSEKSFSSFDWFNIQDADVVKLDKSQYLTNKNLSSTSNVYRDATTELNGAVLIADDINDERNIVVPNVKTVKSKLAEKLSYTGKSISKWRILFKYVCFRRSL